jgi:CspA family cold shock protein
MLAGKVISISKDKGYGFLQPVSGGNDLFFHHSIVVGGFDGLQLGEEVRFEVDPAAQKPRAKNVERLNAARDSSARQTNLDRGVQRTDQPRVTLFEKAELGFITQLRKKEKLGFVSADCGGPELLFGAENISGIRLFSQLAIGDSVRFLRGNDADDAGPPLASAVQFTERRRKKSDLDLPQNPRARRKKPSWRR